MNCSTFPRTAGASAAALWLLAGALVCAQVDTNPPAEPPPDTEGAQPPDATPPAPAPATPPGLEPGGPGRGAVPSKLSAERLEQLRKALSEAMTNRPARAMTNPPARPPAGLPVAAPPQRSVPTNVPAAVFPPRAAAPPTLPPGTAPAAPTASAGQLAPPAGEPGGGTSGAPPLTPAVLANAPYVFSWKNAPLDQIFEKYSEITGRTVLQPATLPGAVTLFTSPTTTLTRDEAVQALDGALALNGVTMIPLGEKFVKAVQAANAMQEGGRLNYVGAKELPEAEQFVTHVVQLKVVLPSEMAQLFGTFTKNPQGIVPIDSSQILVLRDYASNIKRMVELIEKVDIEPESEYKLEVIPIKYGRVGDLYDTMSSLITGGAGGAGMVRTPSQRRTGTGTTGVPGAFGAGGRLGGTTGRYGGTTGRFGQTPAMTGVQQQAVPGQPGTPGATGTSFQQRLNQIISRAAGESGSQVLGDARIVPDERANSLIVYANKHDMAVITNIVSKVDVLLAQVLIEGIVLGVAMGDSSEMGVSWIQNMHRFGNDFTGAGAIQNALLSLTNFPSSAPGGFSYFGKIGDDLSVIVRAVAADSRVRVLQRPRIQTSHAVPGMFFSGSTVPYVTGYYNYGGYGGVGTQSQVEQIQVGVNLNVTPYITPDGLVVLDIFQDISQLGEYVKIDQNDVPTTTSRSAQATLSVRDGETIMLGGYIEENRTSGKSGVPILKDLPGLGMLFRSKTTKNSRQELILLMKVTVLKNPSDASALAAVERTKLPGVRKAEQEFLKTEQEADDPSAKHLLKD